MLSFAEKGVDGFRLDAINFVITTLNYVITLQSHLKNVKAVVLAKTTRMRFSITITTIRNPKT